MRVKTPIPWSVKAAKPAGGGNFTGVSFGHYFLSGRMVSREEYLAARQNPQGKPGKAERAQAAGKRDPRHNPDLDAAMAAPAHRAHTPALNELVSQDPRHNPALDEAFGMGGGPATGAGPTDAGRHPSRHAPHVTYGDPHDRDSDDRYFDRQIAAGKRRVDQARGRLADAEAHGARIDALRNDPAAQAEIVRRVQADLAAQRGTGKPKRSRRDTSHIGRDLFAERAGLSEGPKPAADLAAGAPSPPGQGGTDASLAAPVEPPPLPHHRTHATALAAANKLVAFAKAGKNSRHLREAHAGAILALHEHERAGHAAIDRMAKAKYGDSARGRFLAAKAKREFGMKMTAARERLAKAAGFRGSIPTGRLVKEFGAITPIELDPLVAFQLADLELIP